MAVRFVLDTSVLTRMSQEPVRAVVRAMWLAGGVGCTTVSALEYTFSARNAKEWDGARGALSVFEPVTIEARHFERAGRVQRLLASRSQMGRKIPDLLIAAVAEELNATVLHYDADFDHISAVTGQAVQWVVPAGTVA